MRDVFIADNVLYATNTVFGVSVVLNPAPGPVTITGNIVHAPQDHAIVAGWGPYLRNVLIANNVVREADIGIAVSVAEGAGTARVSGNIIDARGARIVGMAWTETVSADLAAEAGRFPNVVVSDNS
jgi:hypothetical protein